MDPTLGDGLASHTSMCIDVRMAMSHGVGVCNPAHFPGPRPHVRSRDIQTVCMWGCVRVCVCGGGGGGGGGKGLIMQFVTGIAKRDHIPHFQMCGLQRRVSTCT